MVLSVALESMSGKMTGKTKTWRRNHILRLSTARARRLVRQDLEIHSTCYGALTWLQAGIWALLPLRGKQVPEATCTITVCQR